MADWLHRYRCHNGSPVRLSRWHNLNLPGRVNGKMAFEGTFDIPAGILASSNNLTISLPGISGRGRRRRVAGRLPGRATRWAALRLGLQLIFWGQIPAQRIRKSEQRHCLRAYDVTDPNNPQRLSNYTTSGNQI